MHLQYEPPAKILVVDDDAINLSVLSQMLAISGFQSENAVDGVEAVEMAAMIHPTLVLMDISMPRMNGIDAAIAIRMQSVDQCPRLVAVTANVTDRQREACKTAGFDGFLAKPIDMKAWPLRQRRRNSDPGKIARRAAEPGVSGVDQLRRLLQVN
jgi:CheY-like chemotaxis protein